MKLTVHFQSVDSQNQEQSAQPRFDYQLRKRQKRWCRKREFHARLDRRGPSHYLPLCGLHELATQYENLTRIMFPIPSGCLNLNWIKIHAVKSPNAPRKTMRTTPGTRPTTASDEGKESIPLLTISAIMRAATSSHDSVLYLIFGIRGTISQHPRFARNEGSLQCGESRATASMK